MWFNCREPQFDFEKLRGWNKSVVNKLNTGLNGLAKMRKVQVIEAVQSFLSKNEVEVTSDDGSVDSITFKKCHYRQVQDLLSHCRTRR